MKKVKSIETIKRYTVNDFDRSSYIRLDRNELNIEFPSDLLEEIRSGIDSYIIQSYPSDFMVYESLSGLLETEKEKILLVPGADYGLKICYESIIREGDKVAYPEFTYAMNEVYAKTCGAVVTLLPLTDELKIDRTELERSLPGTEMLVIANPNQPTGQIEDREFLILLIKECEKQGIWVIIDEAYYPYGSYSLIQLVDEYANLVIVRSFSKHFGLAGLRAGVLVSNRENIEYFAKALPVFSINSIAHMVIRNIAGYHDYYSGILAEQLKGRKKLLEYYTGIGCKPYKSETNFLLVESNNVFNSEEYIDYLYKNKILIRGPWNSKPFKDAFRITLSSEKNISTLIRSTDRYIGIN